MKKYLLIFMLICAPAYAQMIFNPVMHANWACIFPISIGGIPMGTSGNPGADVYDKSKSGSTFICYCPLLRFGITFGMTKPAFIAEATPEAFRMPTFGGMLGAGAYRKGGSDYATKESRTSFVHTHIHKMSLLEILNIFTDALCMKKSGAPFDALYLSEVDPVANNSNLAAMTFPETVLVANPVVAMSCAVDAVSTTAGVPMDTMYWCFGAASAYSASNYSNESAGYEASIAATVAKTMMRYQRYTLGKAFPLKSTQAAISLCGFHPPLPILLKSQYRLQPAYPIFGMCGRLGTSPLLWNSPKRSLPNGDSVFIIWEREDCCAL